MAKTNKDAKSITNTENTESMNVADTAASVELTQDQIKGLPSGTIVLTLENASDESFKKNLYKCFSTGASFVTPCGTHVIITSKDNSGAYSLYSVSVNGEELAKVFNSPSLRDLLLSNDYNAFETAKGDTFRAKGVTCGCSIENVTESKANELTEKTTTAIANHIESVCKSLTNLLKIAPETETETKELVTTFVDTLQGFGTAFIGVWIEAQAKKNTETKRTETAAKVSDKIKSDADMLAVLVAQYGEQTARLMFDVLQAQKASEPAA